jgi:hypothetical protein
MSETVSRRYETMVLSAKRNKLPSMRSIAIVFILIFTQYSHHLLPQAIGRTPETSQDGLVARKVQNTVGYHLSALGELPFGNANTYGSKLSTLGRLPFGYDTGSSSFRFVCLPSFHNPMCVRIERKKDGTTVLYARKTGGTGGYAPGELLIDHKKPMSSQKYAEFTEKLNTVNFFGQPPDQDKLDVDDGSQWIFEANDHGRYHIVNTCGGGALRDLGVFLLKEGDILPSKPVF